VQANHPTVIEPEYAARCNHKFISTCDAFVACAATSSQVESKEYWVRKIREDIVVIGLELGWGESAIAEAIAEAEGSCCYWCCCSAAA
jgi:hypothetical protein